MTSNKLRKFAEKTTPYLFKIFVFLIPVQLAYHFWPLFAFVKGIRVDYLAPTIYFTELLLVVLITAWFISIGTKQTIRKLFRQTQFRKAIPLVVIALLINLVFSINKFVTLIHAVKLAEIFLLAMLVATYRKLDLKKDLFIPLATSSVLFAAIGVTQTIKGATLGGVFYYLGERTFSTISPGIALYNLFGREVLRSYSTFPHPNALAGYLGVVALISIFYLGKKFNILSYLLLIGMFFTFSKSALVDLATVSLIYLLVKKFRLTPSKHKLSFFYLLVLSNLLILLVSTLIVGGSDILTMTLGDRIYLNNVSLIMFMGQPLTGVGLGNYIIRLSQASPYYNYHLLLQPVHNLFLLVLVEGGLVLTTPILYGTWKIIEKVFNKNSNLIYVFLFIFLTGLTDHYWFTLWQNNLLLSLVLGLTIRRKIS